MTIVLFQKCFDGLFDYLEIGLTLPSVKLGALERNDVGVISEKKFGIIAPTNIYVLKDSDCDILLMELRLLGLGLYYKRQKGY